MRNIIPVVLCGGVGSRLWPLSRKSLPKQFAPLIGDQSLFAAAVKRTAQQGYDNPIVVTSSDHRFLAEKQLFDCGLTGQILLEPEGKNTAPAVFAAAHFAIKNHSEPLLLIMPSDHHIPDKKAFNEMVQDGYIAAKEGAVVTFGVKPDRPETGYGYIELAGNLKEACNSVTRFHEKPDLEIAQQMFEAGNYVWNAGIFLFQASTILMLAEKYEPAMLAAVIDSIDCAKEDKCFWHIDINAWSKIKGRSIDYAILEKTNQIACVKFDGSWSDLGDWNAVARQLPRDKNKNLLTGSVSEIECCNTALWSTSDRTHLVGLGLENIVAVVTDDAVLVADVAQMQNVRNVVDLLDSKSIAQAHQHAKDYRPWGWFESLVNMPGYQVKRLHVHPGAALSLQSHQYRSEHWVVVAGTATVVRGSDTEILDINESVYIHVGQRHRLANETDAPLTVIEVQTGSYLGEDDIVRYEDVYNRNADE